MKSRLSYWLIGALVTVVIAMGSGFWYSCRLDSKVTEAWKQTLWEDYAFRMREINVKKKQGVFSEASSDIIIETEDQTLCLKKDSIASFTVEEGDFLADQFYLSLKNPIKIKRLDSLFQLKLKEKGLDYQTAVSLCNKDTKEKSIYGQEDIQTLYDYLKLTYKVDIKDVILVEGYVKGGWLTNLVWSNTYYIILSLLIIVLGGKLVMIKRKLRKSSTLQDELNHSTTETDQSVEAFEPLPSESLPPEPTPAESLPSESLSPESTPAESLPSESLSPEPTPAEPLPSESLPSEPTPPVSVPQIDEEVKDPVESIEENADTIYLDVEKHTVTYAEKTILLAPKLFSLFYYLSQGKDHFQSYEFLFNTLGQPDRNADKKQVEQIKIRLQNLLENISDWEIITVRGSGYQLNLKKDLTVKMEGKDDL